jgi:uncharacterized membrane protein YfcA
MGTIEQNGWTDHHRRASNGIVNGWTLLVAAALVGGLAGFLGGLFGKGGSAIATPILAALGVPPLVAVASPLPASVPSMFVSGRRYRGAGLVEHRVALLALVAGLPATAIGAYATRWISGGALVIATEVMLLVLGVRFVVHPAPPHEVATEGRAQTVKAIVVGAGVGFLSGLLANAGGFLLAPLFVVLLRLPIKAAFGTSLAVALFLSIPGTVVHAALGHVDWALVAAFALGSVPAASLGARTALRAESRVLGRWYGAGLAVLAVVLLAVSR